MKKIRWKYFITWLVIYTLIDVVLLLVRDQSYISNIVYYALRGINLAAFVVFGVGRSITRQ